MIDLSSPDHICSEHQMLADERTQIASLRNRSKSGKWIGLALSGGGIRSATFCLGALQRLAKGDLLRHFDYLSSVSGGGYLAASLQWWWLKSSETDAGAKFPYGTTLTSRDTAENQRLAFLRWHSSYLAPGGGINILSLIAVLLRTVLTSLFVWVPMAALLMVLVELTGDFFLCRCIPFPDKLTQLQWGNSIVDIPAFSIVAAVLCLFVVSVFFITTILLILVSIVVPPETTGNHLSRLRRAIYCVFGGMIVAVSSLYEVGVFSEGFFTEPLNWSSLLADWQDTNPATLVFVIIGLASSAFALTAILIAAAQLLDRLTHNMNYGARRLFDLSAPYAFTSLLPLGVLASLPVVAWYVERGGHNAALGGVASLSGVVSALYGHFVQAQRVAPKYASRWAATVGAAVFLYCLVLISYLIAHFILQRPMNVTSQTAAEFFPAVTIFAFLFGWVSNLNNAGLHRFYRDRLMEAFLPSNSQHAAERPKYSSADGIPIADFWDKDKVATSDRPYPLFNTNAILINDPFDRRVALRGGASFVLSPLFIGSRETNWIKTKSYDELHGQLTMASAMAASGAAANANAAYIGSGITRDRLISIVMMLMNMRLGLWVGAPKSKASRPNYFSPGLKYGVLRTGYRRDSTFMELTDGGHFDNLGVYELVRRRSDVIFALDSEEDPSTAMAALASVCQRVSEDFGVIIDVGEKADTIVPLDESGYPSGAKYSARSFFITPIYYPAPDLTIDHDCEAKTGLFVYIKSNMIKGLSFPAKGYKARNADFPNQSTMDQFFEPAQFEAYRELGYASIDAVIVAAGLENTSQSDLISKLQGALAESLRSEPPAI